MIFGTKKGNAAIEGITIVVLLTVIAISSIWSYYTFDQLNSEIMGDADISQEAKDVSNTLYSKHSSLMDNLFLFAFVLFVLFTIISAFVIDSHPIFFFVSIILLIGVFVVAGILGNTFDDIMQDSTISQYANDFTYASWVMRYLLELIIAIVFIISIVLFIKFKG